MFPAQIFKSEVNTPAICQTQKDGMISSSFTNVFTIRYSALHMELWNRLDVTLQPCKNMPPSLPSASCMMLCDMTENLTGFLQDLLGFKDIWDPQVKLQGAEEVVVMAMAMPPWTMTDG